ncbi:unnamed protein product [Mytilus coruscus]|uniref:Mab-21-like HhH/H2TH-like domain-containing protein n=1 Tax=Mytilus coruscus TaxID=42192 RepID=A0A6J8DJ30_MYTCO|nr:unnamed protein product [Mytilus coruscus]
MHRQSRNQDNSDDENLFGITKHTYWKSYGVKRFTYRGKRKFTPLLYQSLDGGMVISNDVFGLTISQFERMYKACLERRKTKEQYILNLRYPDKSSKEYLEYLENCTDCYNDLRWIDPREKNLYKHLVQTVGSEIDIRTRQRLFIIYDMIVNSPGLPDRSHIFSGSLAEGLDLPGSDMDVMVELNDYTVIHNTKNIKNPNDRNMFVMKTDLDYPGFVRLRHVSAYNIVSLRKECGRCPPGTCSSTQFYLPIEKFLDKHIRRYPNAQPCKHGPCVSDKEQTIDIAFCIRSKYLPYNAIPWATRHRGQWPPNFVIDKIMNYGCLLVPIGPKTVSDNRLLWRVSFSVAEKLLVHSFSFTHFLCYGLLKLTLKRIIDTNSAVKGLLCSYFLKTALFWVSEKVELDIFQLSQIYQCFSLCLEKIISWVKTCHCPNYFIPEQNMFLGKIDRSNNTILLCVLESIQCGGIDGLIQHLFLHDNDHLCLLNTKSESSFVLLDFLLYRSCCYMTDTIPEGISNYNKALSCIENFLNSESSTFIIDACKFYINCISQKLVHLLLLPNEIGDTYRIHKLHHALFKRIIKINAVSGWLLYASFYYVKKQFKVTLSITDYILSRWSPYLMMTDTKIMNEIHRTKYNYTVHFSMTLEERVIIATAQHVNYRQHSPLIPEELQLEVEFRMMNILPNVMARCLRFLCYDHLGEACNRRQALRDFYLTIRENECISLNTVSNELTILGVCYEISGARDAAYQCYEEALQCEMYVCPSAEARRSKLFEI